MKLSLLFILIALGCSHSFKNEKYFADKQGCFLLYNVKSKTFEKVMNEDNCHKRMPPFSTFKVPLAVMAFDSKVLKDENVVLKWNGIQEKRVEANRDHNAKTWMRDSIVWFSQRLTSKMGEKQLQKYLSDFKYGNEDISAGLTTAWLESPSSGKGILISPYEQVQFMEKLWTDTLPVSIRSMELTQKITYLETSPKGFEFSGKTGSNYFDKERTLRAGWFIGHLENASSEYIVVTNFSDTKAYTGDLPGGINAKEITKDILKGLGLW